MSKPVATSASAQKKLAERAELKATQMRMDLATLLATDAGRRVFRDLIYAECAVEACIPPSVSPTYFLEGKRAVGLKLLSSIQTLAPRAYLTMVEEELLDRQLDLDLQRAAQEAAKDDDE